MPRFFLNISYDGSCYSGWQIQPNESTIQGEIERILSQLYNQKISVVGCGRTDAGVHASDFYVHFDSPHPINSLTYRIESMLPDDIHIKECTEVSNEAHSRYDATSRMYQYHIHGYKDPFLRHYSWKKSLQGIDHQNIQDACILFTSHTNYKSLSRANEQIDNYHCTVDIARWDLDPKGQKAIFTVRANRFLHNMVRRMVGCLIHIGEKKITLHELQEALEKEKKLPLNMTVPPNGLFLTEVCYPYISKNKIVEY